MQLSEELKTSASLANSLNDQVYKQLIKLCFLELLKEDSVEGKFHIELSISPTKLTLGYFITFKVFHRCTGLV